LDIEKAILLWILCMLIIIGACFGLGYISSVYVCKETGSKMNFPSQYNGGIGCMIQMPDGKWIPLANYRYMETK